MYETERLSVLAALVEQARSLASRIAGDADQDTPCHFCGAAVPLWENLLVMQLTGFGAHVLCPEEALKSKLQSVGPAPEFPYDEFCASVEKRMKMDHPESMCGEILIKN